MSKHRERCLATLEHFEQTGEQPEQKIGRLPGRPYKDLTGQQIGRWIAYEYEIHYEGEAHRPRSGWICVCTCPAHTEKWIRTDSLMAETSKGCMKCRRRKPRKPQKINPRRRESLEYLKRTDPEGLKRDLRPFEYEIIFGEPRTPEEHAAYLERQEKERQDYYSGCVKVIKGEPKSC